MENKRFDFDMSNYEYASFTDRLLALLLDMVIIFLPIVVIENIIYNQAVKPLPIVLLFEYIIPIIITLYFWKNYGATPGKGIMKIYVVDERKGTFVNTVQGFFRYLCYTLSTICLGLGFIWVAIDKKNQAWHDKIVGTIVIKRKKINDEEQVR